MNVNPKVVDHLVTGLAALQVTPHATMNHVAKVVDEAFHWSDKALSVGIFMFEIRCHLF